MSMNKTLAQRLLDVRDKVGSLLPNETKLHQEIDQIECYVHALEHDLWNYKPAPNFIWSLEDRERLVKGARVSWRVRQYTGEGVVNYLGTALNQEAVYLEEGTWVPLSGCDPKLLIDSPEFLEKKRSLERIEVIATLDRASQTWSPEDKASWMKLKSELTKT